MDTTARLTDLAIRFVELDDTFALRKAVLRPWLTPEEARATWAETPEHFHVGAIQQGRVVSTAGFLIEAHPDYGSEFGPLQWRLRGMASEPALQGQGVGGRVLEFGIVELARRLAARSAASATLWCSGRTGAERFYRRQGFEPIGELYETPGTGPHFVFRRQVAAGCSGATATPPEPSA